MAFEAGRPIVTPWAPPREKRLFRRVTALLGRRLAGALLLDAGAMLRRVQPAAARGGRRPGGAARDRRHGSAPDQVDELGQRVLAVARLGAVALRGQHQ